LVLSNKFNFYYSLLQIIILLIIIILTPGDKKVKNWTKEEEKIKKSIIFNSLVTHNVHQKLQYFLSLFRLSLNIETNNNLVRRPLNSGLNSQRKQGSQTRLIFDSWCGNQHWNSSFQHINSSHLKLNGCNNSFKKSFPLTRKI